jgi:hypothetical protein
MTPENSQSIKPLRPEEAIGRREQLFPPQVIESFNELIAQNCVNGNSRVLKKDIISLMIEKGLNENEIYKKHWLDVEEIYENNGWNVRYAKPGPEDSNSESYFVFSHPKK